MRDYWLTQYILSGIGWAYLLATAIGLALAVKLPKSGRGKAFSFMLVLAAASVLPLQGVSQYREQRRLAEEKAMQYEKAKRLFDERCKTAGEKIYKVAKEVDGIYLSSQRAALDAADQFGALDPAGDSARGIGYVESFFMGRPDVKEKDASYVLLQANRTGAYRFGEIPGPSGSSVIHYVDARPQGVDGELPTLTLKQVVLPSPSAQYKIQWEDISTREDRDVWIAGSRIAIVDMKTNELMAERIGFIFDAGLGEKGGGRQPWSFATYTACPEFPKLHGKYPHRWGLTRNFAERVLKPAKEVN